MMHLYWVALKSIWAKEIHRFMRIWVQTLVPPVITMTLYFIIFGNLIGSRIGDMHGFSYMQFIVPGLIMMSVITNAYANVGNDSNLLIVFYVQIMPDDFVMQLHR
ncbi:ABC transporter permease, partial [Escherichia coli]|nr:ABC transporter permease [Escherichia coli]